MKYNSFSYLWPPRPEQAVPSQQLDAFERQGYIAQVKKNGTSSIVAVAPDGSLTFMSRHKEDHKAWAPKPELYPELTALKGDGWYYFIAELLHSKVEGIRDTLYFHDCLVDNGNYLVGVEQQERVSRLQKIFLKGDEEETYSHFVVSPKVWIVREHTSGFLDLFNSLDRPEDEGIVLKEPHGRLQIASRQKSNVGGQLKCRRPHKNFGF